MPIEHGPSSGTLGCTRTVRHVFQCGEIPRKRNHSPHTICRFLQHIAHPDGKLGIDPVVDPEPLPAVAHQFRLAQVREMTGYGRLRRADGVRQLADTELFVLNEQKQTAQAYFVCDSGIKCRGGYIHMDEYIHYRIYRQLHIVGESRI